MIRIGVPGAAGRMGNFVIQKVIASKDLCLGALIEKKGHQAVGSIINGVEVTDNLDKVLNNFDVYIDFTVPYATAAAMPVLSEAGKAAVIATTGLNKNEMEIIKEASKKIPVVYATNYSVGVNVMWKILNEMTKIMKDDYDIDIVESHHRHKKDAPSGTAVTCAEIIMNAKGIDYEKNVIYCREGRDNERPRDQLGVFAVRGGGVVGEHTVYFASDEDKIELKHVSFSRETFATGAIKAARFVANVKKPGLYSMADVLGL